MKWLLPTAWGLLAIESVAYVIFLVGLLRNIGNDRVERSTMFILCTAIAGFLALVGALLTYARSSQSAVAVWAGFGIALLPLLVGGGLWGGDLIDRLRLTRAKSETMQFSDSALSELSQALHDKDTSALRRCLQSKQINWTTPDAAKLFTYAVYVAIEDYSDTAVERVRLLVEAGARTSANELQRVPLMTNVLAGNTSTSVDLLDLVLRAGGNPNATDASQEPLIHLMECTLPKLKVLAQHGATLTALSRQGRQERLDGRHVRR